MTSLTVVSYDYRDTMANKNIPVDQGLWDVNYNGSRLEILTPDFKLIILKSDLNVLTLIVDEINLQSTFSGVGVLGKIFHFWYRQNVLSFIFVSSVSTSTIFKRKT